VLAARQVLLVLDNCEHLIDAVAQLCEMLLPAADDVRILATSREPAGVAGEARYRLPPLGLPEPGQNGKADGRRRWRCSLTGPARRTRISL
jgi:predicted ATPase